MDNDKAATDTSAATKLVKTGYASEKLGFAQIFSKEKSSIGEPSRSKRQEAVPDEKRRVGLALSGGGIRSAAFSLGVLQALKANKMFENIDYLSTVSGGGYIGAALIAGMEREGGSFPFDTSTDGKKAYDAADIADSALVRAIRDRSRYLMPNGKFDLVVSIGIIFRGLAVNATIVAATIFLLAAITLILNPTPEYLSTTWASKLSGKDWLNVDFLLSRVGGTAYLLWLVLWAIGRSLSPTTLPDPGSRAARLTGIFTLILVLVFVAEVQVPILRWVLALREKASQPDGLLTWTPHIVAVLTGGTGVLALTWRWFVSQIQAAAKDPAWRGFFRKLISRIALYVLALALPVLIYISYLSLVAYGLTVSDATQEHASSMNATLCTLSICLAAIMIWLIIWAGKVGPYSATLFHSRWWQAPSEARHIPFVVTLASIALPVVLAAVLLFLPRIFPLPAELAKLTMPVTLGCVGVVLTFIAGLFSANANSLHQLYRDRLNEAFAMGEQGERAFKLSELNRPFKDGSARRPYPIINTAVNLQGSAKNRRGRNADFFVFTPEFAGSDATGYIPIQKLEEAEPHIDLAAAAAISGAAASPAMGRVGVSILAPTLALLNIRLGYWVRNPKFLVSEALEKSALLKEWMFSYLFDEMFGRLDEEHSKVLLSDGGHIDNLGLYQLLKRRCDLIIVSDAEADPAMNCAAIVDVERFARIDLGVRFDVDWKPVREDAIERKKALSDGSNLAALSPSYRHAAIGKIYYPKTQGSDHASALEEKEGVLLYVKSSVTGDERSYILDYERRFPDFPHEATSDQFFSEEQFEAYRALGFHAMERALTVTDESVEWQELLDILRG